MTWECWRQRLSGVTISTEPGYSLRGASTENQIQKLSSHGVTFDHPRGRVSLSLR